MNKITVVATYSNGQLQLTEPLPLQDGQVVRLEISETPPKKAPDPQRAREILRRISQIRSPEADTSDPYVSENHDHYLYGAPKKKP